MRIENIIVKKIVPNPEQIRRKFKKETIEALADSIEENGLLNPITVVEDGNHYTIVSGERRYRACKLLEMETIPCIVKNVSGQQMLIENLIENIHREDLDPWDKAEGLEKLMKLICKSDEAFKMIEEMEMADTLTPNQEKIKAEIKKLGMNIHEVYSYLGVLELPEDIQRDLRSMRFTYGTQLLRIKDKNTRRKVFKRIKGKKMNILGARKIIDDVIVGRISKDLYPVKYEETEPVFMIINLCDSLINKLDNFDNLKISDDNKDLLKKRLEEVMKKCKKILE